MPQIQTRDDLLFALTLAAELEHSLSCQYLYAAYALKKRPDAGLTDAQAAAVQGWATTLAEIARQEMEHLGLANNLLTAIGGAPHFRRPNFPQPPGAYGIALAAELEPLSLAALDRFIEYERPDAPPAPEADDGVPVDLGYTSIHDLYNQIAEAFARMDEAALFIGPPAAQVDNDVMHQERVGDRRVYGVQLFAVTDRASALRAVEQIIEEGEGAPEGGPDGEPEMTESHYARLLRMRDGYREMVGADPAFAPSHPVVRNPTTREHHRAAGPATRLTHPQAHAVAEVFGTAYEALLVALSRFYTRTDETDAEMYGLQRTAFFPLMVMALRPLAEMLAEMPAFEGGGPERAGAPFEIYRSVRFLPQKAAAWTVLHERLWETAHAATALVGAPDVPPRMAFVAQNLERIAANFADFMALPRHVVRP